MRVAIFVFRVIYLLFVIHYRFSFFAFLTNFIIQLLNSIFSNPIIARLHIEYPMLFELSNTKDNRSMHTGVLEFVAAEGVCYMPFWVFF